MTNPTGTAWETATVDDARKRDIPAIRLVKKSQKNEADVLMGNSGAVHKLGWNIPVVFWKRLVPKKEGQKVRQPLGERYVVIIGRDDFLDMMELLYQLDVGPTVWVQNKATETLSATKVLKGLRDWLSSTLENL